MASEHIGEAGCEPAAGDDAGRRRRGRPVEPTSALASSPTVAIAIPWSIAASTIHLPASIGNALAIASMPSGNGVCRLQLGALRAVVERAATSWARAALRAPTITREIPGVSRSWRARRALRLRRDRRENGAHRKSGPCSSRHPPEVGGTWPLPRTFTTMLTATAAAATRIPRWKAFMTG